MSGVGLRAGLRNVETFGAGFGVSDAGERRNDDGSKKNEESKFPPDHAGPLLLLWRGEPLGEQIVRFADVEKAREGYYCGGILSAQCCHVQTQRNSILMYKN